METHTDKPIPYYTKTGILYTILPYYGKYETWSKILLPIWKQSKSVWDSNHSAFLGLKVKTRWRDPDSVILAKLYQKHVGREIVFNQEFRLHCDVYDEDDYEFLKDASMNQCPDYKELVIENVSDDQESVKIVNDLLAFSTHKCIQEFSFLCDQYSDGDISHFSAGLMTVLPTIVSNIEISSFNVNQANLVNIIECSRNVDTLNILDCQIECNDTLELDPNLDYKIKTLVLDGSCKKQSDEFLNDQKLPILAEAISKTNMKTNLKKVRVLNHHFLQEEVRQIFERFGMNIEVKEQSINLTTNIDAPSRPIPF